MIEVENLSKRYGTKLAVDGLNFVVQPGMVTGRSVVPIGLVAWRLRRVDA